MNFDSIVIHVEINEELLEKSEKYIYQYMWKDIKLAKKFPIQ